MTRGWPRHIWIVRHGESAGNVARDAAMSARATHIEIAERDVDVPLSALGVEQAQAVGRWFADLPAAGRPEIVLTSPYARAVKTAELVQAQVGGEISVDERLREKEFGVL